MNRLGDTSAFVFQAGQLLLTRRGKTRMYTVGIEFELYTVPFNDVPSYGLEVNNRFLEVCDTLGVTQIVNEPTRESNILDLLLVTSPNRYSDVEIVPGISDHDAVCVTYLERVKGALYRIQILCRRYTFWSYPAG